MIERWLPIPGFAGYEVSDMGRVRSIDRTITSRRIGGAITLFRRGRLLSLKTHKRTGYVGVEIAGRDTLVHRLVLAAFVGPCPSGRESAHGDGVRSNNQLSNLRYATRAENAADRVRHGTAVRGDRAPSAKLTEDDVREIRSSCLSGAAEAAKRGVSRTLVNMVRRREIWAHV